MCWIPSHKEILGDEEADKLDKQASMQQGNTSPIIPSILRLSLPHSKTACKTDFYKRIKEDASNNFRKSTRYDRMHTINPKAPSHDYRELMATLTRHQSSILMQLCTGHAQLNRHLYNIGATATPICPACNRQEETVQHYLLSWMAHTQHHQVLINMLQRDALHISKLLSDPTCVPHTLNYIATTQQFQSQSSSPPLDSQEN